MSLAIAMSSVSAAAAVLATVYWRHFQSKIADGQPVGSLTKAGSNQLVVTEAEVMDAQAAWATAIKRISKVYLDKGDYVKCASNAAAELYGYGHSNVLFKPTKAAKHPFRPTGAAAMSYFVGGKAVEGGYDEDAGFAINGGKGWSEVVFDNHQIDLIHNVAIAMGEYRFTCSTTGKESKVEYTFGYKKNRDGKVRIFLHHSSVPYKNHEESPTVVRSHLGSLTNKLMTPNV